MALNNPNKRIKDSDLMSVFTGYLDTEPDTCPESIVYFKTFGHLTIEEASIQMSALSIDELNGWYTWGMLVLIDVLPIKTKKVMLDYVYNNSDRSIGSIKQIYKINKDKLPKEDQDKLDAMLKIKLPKGVIDG